MQCYGALARSSDGTTVQDQGYILDWADPSVWGYGDELMLQGAYYHNGTYNVYYLATGYGVSWGLGVASGPAKESISTDTRAALVEGQYIGGCNPISIDANTIALFIEESFTNRTIEVRKANVNTPEDFSAPIEMYTVAPYHIFSTIYLDRETSTWFMYQTDQTGGGNQIIVRTAPMQFVPPSTPYYGTPFAVPCRIEAEDYNLGSQHVAYWDADAGNNGGQYRVDDVDLENALDDGGGYNVGWTHVGEWLEYTVDVANAGMYRIDARVASGEGGGTFRILMDGVDVTGAQSFDDTGGSQNWITRTVPSEVFLDSGQQVLRVSIEQSGWTLNWIEFAKAGGGGCSMAQREARATSMLILALYLIPAVALVLIVRTRRRK